MLFFIFNFECFIFISKLKISTRKLTKKKIEKCGMNLKKIGNKINKMPKLTQTLAWPYGEFNLYCGNMPLNE